MPTTTPNLGLTLPTPNVDTGWGSTLNADFTVIDNVFAAGGNGPSVGLNVGAGKTLNVGGTLVGAGTIILGSGDGTGTVSAPVIRGAARTGTNVQGPNLVIDAPNGTGNQGSGDIVFRTSPYGGASGSTPVPLVNQFIIGRDWLYGPTAAAYTNSTILATTAHVYSTVVNVPINYRTGSAYTLVASDRGKMVQLDNGTAISLTVPSGIFSSGDRIDVTQLSGGQVTFVAGGGMTLFSSGSKVKLSGQFSGATLHFWDTSRAQIIGDLA